MLSDGEVSQPGDQGEAPGTHHWSRTATVEDVPAIRDFVDDACRSVGASTEVAFRLSLAAEEASANVVLHGYRGGPGLLDLRIHASGKAVSLIVRDEAPVFDPTKVRTAPISGPAEEREPGHLGIHLIRELTDGMTHRVHGAGNELTVTIDDREGE